MKPCILCGKQTDGSVGAAGIKWSIICQECKDREDNDLARFVTSVTKSVDLICEALSQTEPTMRDEIRKVLRGKLIEAGQRKSLYDGTFVKLNSDTMKWFLDQAIDRIMEIVNDHINKRGE